MKPDYQVQLEAQQRPQAIAPSISIRTYFITVLVLSVLIALAIQSGSVRFQVLLGLLCFPVIVFLVGSALTFMVALLVGALRQLLFQPVAETQSPFATEVLPPQVIPRQARD